MGFMYIPAVRFLDAPRNVISAETVLEASDPQSVYDLVSDVSRHSRLDGSGTVQRRIAGPERADVGDRVTQSMRLYGIPYRISFTVTRAEPGRAFAWRMPTGHTWTWEVEPAEGGGVLVRETFDARPARLLGLPLAGIFRLNGSFARNRKGIATSLARLHRTVPRGRGLSHRS
jgi:hypothetical protein